VEVTTDLNMTGMVAQYGRASGLMKEIAGAILTQFADNLRKEIERSTPAPATTSPTPEAAPAATTTGATDPAPALAAADSAAAPAPAATSQASPAPARSPAPAAVPVSAFSILWIALRNWIGGLFGRKS
jgi:hypothetical protein